MSFERIAPEQHDTLEGVPEPSENPHLFGHQATGAMLAGAYRGSRLPHAMLFSGPAGIGKATLAFHLAHHLLQFSQASQAPDQIAPPDPQSPLFRQIAIGAHPSVLHLTRPVNEKTKGFKTEVTVEEIRRINRFLSMTSHDGGYRVVIIDTADDMNTNAANALLKNLEEPPARTVFILIAHSPGALLPTIRSRCHLIKLASLETDDLKAALVACAIQPPQNSEAQNSLHDKAGGSVRAAILLTQYGGMEIAETVDRIVRSKMLDMAGAHRLADAVAGRDKGMQFDIFNRQALDILADAARTAALCGNGRNAHRFADEWQASLTAIAEAETYNLDRKQHVLNMVVRLQETLRM